MGWYRLPLKRIKHANVGHIYYRDTTSVLINSTAIIY